MLHLFGKPYVELDGRPAAGTPLPANALLVVALLSLRFAGTADRSELAATLRENAEPTSASGYLRTLLLRTRLWSEEHGEEVFAAGGRMLLRSSGHLRSDLDLFLAIEEINTASDLDGLLSIYRGDFLAGIDAEGAELKQWLHVQRERLRERFIRLAVDGADLVGGAVAERALMRVADEGPSSDEGLQTRLEHSPNTSAASGRPAAAAPRSHSVASGGNADPPQVQPLAGVPRVALMLPVPGPYSFTQLQRLLASSIVEDVTLNLCRLRAVAPIAPHTIRNLKRAEHADRISAQDVEYVVETRLMPARVTGDDLQLTLSLTRTRTGEMVWATDLGISRASGPIRQAELSGMLAAALVDAVAEAELRTPVVTAPATAYYNYLLGRRALRSLDLASVRRARAALRKARLQAPAFAPALSLFARTLSLEWVLLGRSEPELLREAETVAKEAIDLDPFDASGYHELGRTVLFLHGPDASLEHHYAAERLAPHNADILVDSADTLLHNSDLDRAHERMELALNLNPIPPDEYRWTAGGVRFFRGDYEQGLQMLRGMRQPEPASRLMAACAAMAGDRRAAEQYTRRAMSLHPDFTIEKWIRVLPQRAKEHQEKYVEALRLAGFK
jgi:tetratricopeptide (TPR) repeat protein